MKSGTRVERLSPVDVAVLRAIGDGMAHGLRPYDKGSVEDRAFLRLWTRWRWIELASAGDIRRGAYWRLTAAGRAGLAEAERIGEAAS